MLEETIRKNPPYYLWTHNRWKRTKEEFDKRYEGVKGKLCQKRCNSDVYKRQASVSVSASPVPSSRILLSSSSMKRHQPSPPRASAWYRICLLYTSKGLYATMNRWRIDP